MIAIQCSVVFMIALNLLASHPRPWQIIGFLVTLPLLGAVQAIHCAPATFWIRERYGKLTLILQALLTFIPTMFFGLNWVGLAGLLAGSILLVLEPPLSIGLFACVCITASGIAILFGSRIFGASWLVVSILMIGTMIYGLGRIAELVAELHRARGAATRLAIEQERLRMARDLHDLLGYSLSVITLKSELTVRLVGSSDDRARTELLDILQTSRQALSDVRSMSRGYRNMRIADESASVRGVLLAAGIEVSMDMSVRGLPVDKETVLATVLREGVTNLLRHSRAKRCRIDLREVDGGVRLTVSNDGLAPGSASTNRPGGGLDNLTERLTRVGGRLRATADPDGWFYLVAECPTECPTGPRHGAGSGDPAGVTGDPHRVQTIAGTQLGHHRTQVVPDGTDGEVQLGRYLRDLSAFRRQ
jgi:two-component system sensor histidine kinase DesK